MQEQLKLLPTSHLGRSEFRHRPAPARQDVDTSTQRPAQAQAARADVACRRRHRRRCCCCCCCMSIGPPISSGLRAPMGWRRVAIRPAIRASPARALRLRPAAGARSVTFGRHRSRSLSLRSSLRNECVCGWVGECGPSQRRHVLLHCRVDCCIPLFRFLHAISFC